MYTLFENQYSLKSCLVANVHLMASQVCHLIVRFTRFSVTFVQSSI